MGFGGKKKPHLFETASMSVKFVGFKWVEITVPSSKCVCLEYIKYV